MAEDMGGADNPQVAQFREIVDKFEAAFDEKQAAAEWKKRGLEVAKSSSSDKDGWKGFQIEGSAKSIAEYNKAQAESRKSAKGPMGGVDAATFVTPRFPKFYKTDKPNVAKVVFAWRDQSTREARTDRLELSDDEKENVEMALEQGRAQFAFDDLKIEMRVRLPGKILTSANCKQDGDQLVVQMLGSEMSADSVGKMRLSPTATIEFDPKEFKIPLEEEPQTDSRPSTRSAGESRKVDVEKAKDEQKEKER
jgi:hypothetical protein